MISVERSFYDKFPQFASGRARSFAQPVVEFLRRVACEERINASLAALGPLSGFDFVERALEQLNVSYSVANTDRENIPVDGRVVAAGVNLVVPQHCPVAHAEIVAFAAAGQRLGRARFNDDGRRYVLATSAQPCAMCYGALFWAGIDEILIGARSGDVMALSEFDEGPLPGDWIGELTQRGIGVRRDILRDEARALFDLYSRSGGERY